MKKCIYIIQNTSNNYYKIGFAKNPQKRVKQLQTGSSDEIVLCYFRECEYYSKVEKAIHRDYSEYNVINEWYDINISFSEIDDKIRKYEKMFKSIEDNPFV